MSVLDILGRGGKALVKAGKRYGMPWVVGAAAGKVLGGAGGGVLGYLSADEDASAEERYARALAGGLLGVNFGGVTGGAIGAGPRIARDVAEALAARTAANDMPAIERLVAAGRKAGPMLHASEAPTLGAREADNLNVGYQAAPRGMAPNDNQEGFEAATAHINRGRPFDDNQILFDVDEGDNLRMLRPAASEYARSRWGMDLEGLPPPRQTIPHPTEPGEFVLYDPGYEAALRAQRGDGAAGPLSMGAVPDGFFDNLAAREAGDAGGMTVPEFAQFRGRFVREPSTPITYDELIARLREAGLIQ